MKAERRPSINVSACRGAKREKESIGMGKSWGQSQRKDTYIWIQPVVPEDHRLKVRLKIISVSLLRMEHVGRQEGARHLYLSWHPEEIQLWQKISRTKYCSWIFSPILQLLWIVNLFIGNWGRWGGELGPKVHPFVSDLHPLFHSTPHPSLQQEPPRDSGGKRPIWWNPSEHPLGYKSSLPALCFPSSK